MNLRDINRLLVIRLSSLGDIILATPLLRSIKNRYPGISIDFLIKEQYADVVKHNPYLNKIYYYSPGNQIIKELRQNKYNLIVDLQNNRRSKGISSAVGAETEKFKKRSVDKFLLVNFKINNLRNAPPVPVRYAESIPGFSLDDQGTEIFIPENVHPQIQFSKNNIGLAPGSRHFSKRWPVENFIKLSLQLQASGYNIFLFGGKSDKKICREIAERCPGAADLSNDDNLLQTAADMKHCAVIVCNDSGLMHTASAVKTPVLVFFGSSVKEFGFVPFRNKNLILENKLLSCRPCSHIGRENCPKGHFRCMLELTPQTAYESILTLLNS